MWGVRGRRMCVGSEREEDVVCRVRGRRMWCAG